MTKNLKLKKIPYNIQDKSRMNRMISEWENEAQIEVRNFGQYILSFILTYIIFYNSFLLIFRRKSPVSTKRVALTVR